MTISTYFDQLKSSNIVKALLPMGYVPDMPILAVKGDALIMTIPFLRYQVTGKVDQTLVFPIRYTIDVDVPSMRVVGFTDLAFSETYKGVNFNNAVGKFRHDAVKHLDRNQFAELKRTALEQYDKLADAIVADTPYTEADDQLLAKKLGMLVEPCLYPFYRTLNAEFFARYIHPDTHQ